MPCNFLRYSIWSCLIQFVFLLSAWSLAAADSNLKPVLSTRELASNVGRSLVLIITEDHAGNVVAQGSGFFFRPGLVATNLHVLKHATQGHVKTLSDGKKFQIASVVGFDTKHDICILKLPMGTGTPLTLSADKVAAGDDILVAGNPEGLEASFSKGIVSGVRSDSGLLQMDAAISPGSSGGPVVNNRGEVIGISVSSLREGQNLNFAVPVRYLRELELDWDLPVPAVGAFAVTDLEDAGFHGPVKTFIERKSAYEYDPSKKGGPVYVRDVPVAGSRFSPDGQLLEQTYFEKGVEVSKLTKEYSPDGLVKRVTNRAANPANSFSVELSGERAFFSRIINRYFDEIHPSGKKGELDYHEDTYDSEGRMVEQVFPRDEIKYIWTYDSLGREVETRGYKNGRLWLIFRDSYVTNGRGDWVKKTETLWSSGSAEDEFNLSSESSREITYYEEEQ